MKIKVNRFLSDADTTVSQISIDDTIECYGLEDEYREIKVMAETRIPAGTYQIDLRTDRDFHKRYSNRFPAFHQGMLHIRNVPNFTNILIHCGNTDDNTSGCLLIGTTVSISIKKMTIGSSVRAYTKFYKEVIQAAKDGNLEIEFKDSDR